MSETATQFRVEYRNLLGEWVRDMRAFSSYAEALAAAEKVRRLTRSHQPLRVARQLRTRIRRSPLPPPGRRTDLSDRERWEAVERAMGRL